LERGSGACQSRNSSQRVCDSVTAARARRSRHSDCAMRPRLADAPPAGLAPLLHPTQKHAQIRRTDVCRRPAAGHGVGAARRQTSPLHPTTQSWSAVVRAAGAAQQPIQRRRGVPHHHFDPQSTRSAAPATPSSTPARSAPLRVEEWRDNGGVHKGLKSKLCQSKIQGFAPRIRLPLVSTLKRKF